MRSTKQGNYLKTRTTTRTRFVHACEPTVILAGKSDIHRHSTLSFIRNIVVAKTSYQMLEILSFIAISFTSFIGNRRTNFCDEKSTIWCFPGCYFLHDRRENLKWNVVLVLDRIKSSLITHILRRQKRCAGREWRVSVNSFTMLSR